MLSLLSNPLARRVKKINGIIGTGRLAVLLGNPQKEFRATKTTITQLVDTAGKLSQNRRGALIVVDLGSDLRPEDFLYSGTNIEAQLSTDLLINLFATDTPLHDGAVLVKGNKIISAGVILPLSRQGISRYGTRHLAALGITERFDRCICIVVSEETGTLSLANQGKLERPITSSRLQELLVNLIGNQNSMGINNKSSLNKNTLSQSTNPSDNIISDINEKESNKSEIFTKKGN